MGLRLVNTAPGDVTDPVIPGSTIHMGLRSETLAVQLSTLNLDVGLSNIIHHALLPESDSALLSLASVAFETSERRRPLASSATRSMIGPDLSLLRTSGSLNQAGVYEITVPIVPTNSLLGYFKFEKGTWSSLSPDWCNQSGMTGLYFGLEHGGFNTAAYLFPRDNGTGGSFVFGGPLQAYNTTRPSQVELGQDLDPLTVGNQGWNTLPPGTPIELFIFFNTYASPFQVEVWTKLATQAAPVFQGSVPLSALGTFPTGTFTNSRAGTSNTATLMFGLLGNSGDSLRMKDWALYPDYRAAVRSGVPNANHSFIVSPDAPVLYRSDSKVLPTELPVARWFPVTGASYTPPTPSLFYSPGCYSTPQYLSIPKSGVMGSAFKRVEPRLEGLQDGFMIEAFLAGDSSSRTGDLVGPGLVIEDGQKSYRLVMLETPSERTYGIASTNTLITDASTYYRPATPIDWRSLKLLRMVVDRRRSKVVLQLDEEKVLDIPISTPAILVSELLVFPTTALGGTTLTVDVSTDGGATWTTRSHTFVTNVSDTTSLASLLGADAAFVGTGPSQFVVLDRGSTLGLQTVQTGPLMAIRINGASTSVGVGKLAFTVPGTVFGASSLFPSAPDAIGKVTVGYPHPVDCTADMHLKETTYLPRYLAWEGEDSIAPDSLGVDSGVRFTRVESGVGGQAVSTDGVSIVKTGFTSSADHRYYKKAQAFSSLGGVQVDFGAYVIAYTNERGQAGAPNTSISAGLAIYLGNKRVFLGFFDCGALGRKVAIMPGSGSETDIQNQTLLGRNFSAAVDWTRPNKYRLVVRSNNSIQVWAGSVTGSPIITIPWRNAVDGFDLPLDTSAPALAFGHINNLLAQPSASTTLWKYVRWGYSNGFDVGVQPQYPDGYSKYLFGGREFILSEFNES